MGCNTSQEQRIVSESNEKDDQLNNFDKTGTQQDNIDYFMGKTENNIKGEFIKHNLISPLFEFNEDEEIAATKIQAAFRGHKVRNSVKVQSSNNKSNHVSNYDKIQNSVNEEKLLKEKQDIIDLDLNDKDLENAATKIQATFRGHMQRKTLNTNTQKTPTKSTALAISTKSIASDQQNDNLNDDDIKEITKIVAEELNVDLNDPELNKAALKIQASFRGYKTRKDVTS